MTIFENRKMNPKNMVIVFIAIVILAGIPMWVTNYAQYSNNALISCSGVIVTVVCAYILAYYTSYRKTILILITTAAHLVAVLIKMFIDFREDPTNHNLAPFELALFIILDGIGGSILTMVSRAVRDEQKSREISNKNKK